MLDTITGDVRRAFRGLLKAPGYTLVFVVTLGLGIGVNTAMFSAVSGVLLRPLPHEHGERLVYLRHASRTPGSENALFSVPELQEYRTGIPSLASVAEFSALTFTMLGHEQPRRVRAGIVSGNYFRVMGLSATLGRMVGPEDDGPNAPAVIVLSDAYWRTVFGGDPNVLGKTVEMNRRVATIVGVAEPAPPYPERTDIYVNIASSPHHLDAAMSHDRGHRMTEVFARLADGATAEAVRAEASVVTSRIHAQNPESYDPSAGFQVTVTPLKTQLTSRARPTLLLLLGTAFLVLVIACANLANLTLTRVLRREHELAVRVSLGAGRGRLRRELLVESLVLALTGAAVGVLLASYSLDLLVAFAGRFTSRASEIALDGPVLAFAAVAAVAASLFFALLPPLPGGDDVGEALRAGGTRSTFRSGARRAQRALVVAQVGASFVLLIGAGLLVRTMLHLSRIDPGFDTAQVLSMDIPAGSVLLTDDPTRNKYMAILRDVRALPGVQRAALTSSIPLSENAGGFMTPVAVEGHTPAPGAPTPRADLRVVSSDYFAAMGIDVLRGREFTTTDLEGAQPVVLINRAMARAYFGERDPIGRRISWHDENLRRFGGVGPEGRVIVGVVEDTRDGGVDAAVVHTVYNAYPQIRFPGSLVVRVGGDPSAVVPAVRQAILRNDPTQAIENVRTLADLGSESVAPRRLNAILLGAFALLALVIAAVGIGGVLAFSVGSRTREFGVRSALGAARVRIWAGVVAEGAALAAIGVGLGAIAAVGLTRLISGLLVGVPALDPVTFAAVGLLLGGVAMVAAWIPAWRAAAVSPMEAMRSE